MNYEGEPTQQEITERIRMGNFQIGYKLPCPNCGKVNTEFLRNSYWLCHHCGIWFTTEDAQPIYDVKAYEADDRPDEEDLEC